jgi:hypothetical protein
MPVRPTGAVHCRYEGNSSILLQIISKSKDFDALLMLGAAAKDATASPRTSLDSQQADAASAVAASTISAISSSAAAHTSTSDDVANDIPPFEATDEWLCALRDSLPLEPSLRVLHHLQVSQPAPTVVLTSPSAA